MKAQFSAAGAALIRRKARSIAAFVIIALTLLAVIHRDPR